MSPDARRTSSRVAALVVAGVALVAGVVAIAIDLAVLPTYSEPPMSAGWSGVLPGLALLIPGCLLLWRLPWHPIAVVLAGFGALWVVDGLASAAVNLAWFTDRDAWWAAPAFWFFTRAGSVLILPVTLLLVLFPDGRLRRGGWRVVSIAAIALGLVMPVAFMFSPPSALVEDEPARAELLQVFGGWSLALPLPDAAWTALLAASGPCLMASLVLALVVCVSRRFGASADERAQLRWLLWSGAVFVAALAIFPFVPTQVVDVLLAVTQGLIASSVVVAVTRYRLYAIDRLLSWTLVYAVLVAAIVAVDVLLVLAIGSAIDDRVAMLLAVIVVTVAYAPLRGRLFGFASRLVSGRRADPYDVVSSLGRRLEAAPDGAGRVAALADAIADAFGARFVRVELARAGVDGAEAGVPRAGGLAAETGRTTDASMLAAESGARVADLVVFPIDYAGETIGRIEMESGRRPVVSARDQQLLGDLVQFAAAAIRNAELGRELQEIRERLVLAREAERSRLRRDLHDGLGPLLAGVKLRLETSRNLVSREPARSLELLDAAIDEQTEVIAEIRRIAHDLRPPALDDLGLARAVEQLGERLSGGGVSVSVEAALPRDLPAAAEVAAYRIAAEAIANARKHAGATRVRVRLSVGPGRVDPGRMDSGRIHSGRMPRSRRVDVTRAGTPSDPEAPTAGRDETPGDVRRGSEGAGGVAAPRGESGAWQVARAQGGPHGQRMLRVEVVDDGHGIPADVTRGVGLRSMRERAEELGGTLSIVAARPAGPAGPAGPADAMAHERVMEDEKWVGAPPSASPTHFSISNAERAGTLVVALLPIAAADDVAPETSVPAEASVPTEASVPPEASVPAEASVPTVTSVPAETSVLTGLDPDPDAEEATADVRD
ncbi:histidine kinase [Agromyces aerolatus]|uniref:histidine kinase n=1 Tax=Agromyces sp. LY-1074 TaxID=3074080 RepID=UPI0028635E23|nr:MULTISPECIES: histidine kinase [unclassified Agromyces]MDR5699630.1 histidine kinase [Agromyces sp. LY-1074]MDR5705926.1 histidine kinase [Agromyces sp. LY-1358]